MPICHFYHGTRVLCTPATALLSLDPSMLELSLSMAMVLWCYAHVCAGRSQFSILIGSALTSQKSPRQRTLPLLARLHRSSYLHLQGRRLKSSTPCSCPSCLQSRHYVSGMISERTARCSTPYLDMRLCNHNVRTLDLGLIITSFSIECMFR